MAKAKPKIEFENKDYVISSILLNWEIRLKTMVKNEEGNMEKLHARPFYSVPDSDLPDNGLSIAIEMAEHFLKRYMDEWKEKNA